jgi:hypothetical protein
LTAECSVSLVTSLGTIGNESGPTFACIGYLDGSVEYRTLPELSVINQSGSSFPLLDHTSENVENLISMEDLNTFFEQKNTLDMRKSSAWVPFRLIKSLNGLYDIRLCVDTFNENTAVIYYQPPSFSRLNEKVSEDLIAILSSAMVLSQLNSISTSDIAVVYNEFAKENSSALSNMTSSLFSTFKKLTNSKEDYFFSNEFFDGVSGDAVLLQHAFLSYAAPQSDITTTTLYIIQMAYLREMFERSMLNPVASLEILGATFLT